MSLSMPGIRVRLVYLCQALISPTDLPQTGHTGPSHTTRTTEEVIKRGATRSQRTRKECTAKMEGTPTKWDSTSCLTNPSTIQMVSSLALTGTTRKEATTTTTTSTTLQEQREAILLRGAKATLRMANQATSQGSPNLLPAILINRRSLAVITILIIPATETPGLPTKAIKLPDKSPTHS